jgi:hypothetical protein
MFPAFLSTVSVATRIASGLDGESEELGIGAVGKVFEPAG